MKGISMEMKRISNEMQIPFVGIAFGGRKGSGKDTLAALFTLTRPNAVNVKCKTPIVAAFEKFIGHSYDKGRDDAALIQYAGQTAREENPYLVAEYLAVRIPEVVAAGGIPIVTDMRMPEESKALFYNLNMLCVNVETSPEVQMRRIRSRDGDLRNYKPNDITETHIDQLDYLLWVNNNSEDDGRYAMNRLETFITKTPSISQALMIR